MVLAAMALAATVLAGCDPTSTATGRKVISPAAEKIMMQKALAGCRLLNAPPASKPVGKPVPLYIAMDKTGRCTASYGTLDSIRSPVRHGAAQAPGARSR
jgi:hypothetical protein